MTRGGAFGQTPAPPPPSAPPGSAPGAPPAAPPLPATATATGQFQQPAPTQTNQSPLLQQCLQQVQQPPPQPLAHTAPQMQNQLAAPQHPAPPPPPPHVPQTQPQPQQQQPQAPPVPVATGLQNQLVQCLPGDLSDAPNPHSGMALIKAIRSHDISEARLSLQQRADANFVDMGPSRMTPLHHALEVGGNIDAVNLLLMARANVNAGTATQETPLHLAVQHYMTVPPLVIRMLLCNNAGLEIPDVSGVTPMSRIRTISMVPGASGNEDATNRIRQILDEVSDFPTIDIGVLDRQEKVQSAQFANLQNDKIIFNTETSIGAYNVEQKRIVFMKKLKQMTATSVIKHISVNPELGTLVVVCLETLEQETGPPKMQNVFIIWPNGKLQEEPLRLNIAVDSVPQVPSLSSCAILSRTRGPQLLLSRLVDGKLFSWHLSKTRTQLVGESQLTSKAGLVAVSDDGCWIAAAVHMDGGCHVHVWSYGSTSGLRLEPVVIFSTAKDPAGMAIQQGSVATGHLAIVVKAVEGMPLPPIEILALSADGSARVTFRLKIPSPCCSLAFCHGTTTHLLSGYTDGLMVLCDLPKGTTTQCRGSPDTTGLSISADRTAICATESHCFRIFRAPVAQSPATQQPQQAAQQQQ